MAVVPSSDVGAATGLEAGVCREGVDGVDGVGKTPEKEPTDLLCHNREEKRFGMIKRLIQRS